MDSRTITNLLLATIVAIFVYKWLWPLWKTHQTSKKEAKAERLRIEVEPLYQEYLAKRSALREKHDPAHKWPKFDHQPDMPKEYLADIDALSEAYKGVLIIRFGDHIVMPK